MAEISANALRKNVWRVLERAERGERIRITVKSRPVAELAPLPARPRTIQWETFIVRSEDWRADPVLAQGLAELLPDTTDAP
jgi:prevent-host-death family protein